MRRGTRIVARIISTVGLGAVSGLHALWASGSHWPAKSEQELAEAVVGQPKAVPDAGPTAVVAAAAAGTALVASGALGSGRMQRVGLRLAGTALVLRAAVGGDPALAAMGMPPAGTRFRRLDNRFYRPFCALMGLSLWAAASRRRRNEQAEEPADQAG